MPLMVFDRMRHIIQARVVMTAYVVASRLLRISNRYLTAEYRHLINLINTTTAWTLSAQSDYSLLDQRPELTVNWSNWL
jgi:hypothetical protein